MRTYQDAKTIAKSLRASLASRGVDLTHSECLEIVARQFGFAEWNILAAKLASAWYIYRRGMLLHPSILAARSPPSKLR